MASSDEVTQPDVLLLPRDESKDPELVIFWADTRELLTYSERRDLIGASELWDITTREVMLKFMSRHVVVQRAGSFGAPEIPKRRRGERDEVKP